MKALASDFDGTLYFMYEAVHMKEKDIEAIQRFQNHGHYFGLCTGRPIHCIEKEVFEKIQFDFYILSSGSLILDKYFHKIYEKLLNKDIMLDLYEQYHNDYRVFIQADQYVYFVSDHQVDDIEQVLISDIREIEHASIYGVSIDAFNEENAHRIANDIRQKFQDDVEVFVNVKDVDIVSKGCHKGAALKIYKEKKNIDLMCGIGDSYNDIPMFHHADLSFTFYRSVKSVQVLADKLVHDLSEAIDYIEQI